MARSGIAGAGTRAFLIALAVTGAAGACWPESLLAPLAATVRGSRDPARLVESVRWTLATMGVLCALLACSWPRVCRAATGAADGLERASPTRFWMGLTVCAAAPRLMLAATMSYPLHTDSLWYHRTALSLQAGTGFAIDGHPTAYRFPGYPLLLACGYRLFGPGPEAVWLWGIASTAVILAAMYPIARSLYGERTARLATLLAAFYPAFVLYTGSALSDLPFTAGTLAWVWAVLRSSPGRILPAATAGIGAGLLSYVRGPGMVLAVLTPLLWRLRGRSWRAVLAPTAVLAATTALTVAPWVLRNHACFGIPTLATNVGVNLYIGNGPGGGLDVDYDARPDIGTGGRPINEAERSRLYARATRQWVRDHPAAALRALAVKPVQLYLLETSAVTAWFQGPTPPPAPAKAALYAVNQIAYWAVMALLGFRLVRAVRRQTRPHGVQWTGYMAAMVFTALCLVFFGSDRFRLPIMPWILIEAAVVLAGTSPSTRTSGTPGSGLPGEG